MRAKKPKVKQSPLLRFPFEKPDPLIGLCFGAVILQLTHQHTKGLNRESAVGVAAHRMRFQAREPVGVPMVVSRRCTKIVRLTKAWAQQLQLSSPAYWIGLAPDEASGRDDVDTRFYLHFPQLIHTRRRYQDTKCNDHMDVWGPSIVSVEDHHEWLDELKFYVPKAHNPRHFEYHRRTAAVESDRIKSTSSEEDENIQVQIWLREWYRE